VWSGNIDLENVQVKKSIFLKLKLPLTLRHGRIKKLQIIVPWRSLSSFPVEIIIEGVNIVIGKSHCDHRGAEPKGKSDWELIETFNTDFTLREQLL